MCCWLDQGAWWIFYQCLEGLYPTSWLQPEKTKHPPLQWNFSAVGLAGHSPDSSQPVVPTILFTVLIWGGVVSWLTANEHGVKKDFGLWGHHQLWFRVKSRPRISTRVCSVNRNMERAIQPYQGWGRDASQALFLYFSEFLLTNHSFCRDKSMKASTVMSKWFPPYWGLSAGREIDSWKKIQMPVTETACQKYLDKT